MRLDASGNLIVGGTTAQGASAVTLTPGGSIITDGFVRPYANGAYDLGSSSTRWKDVYLTGKVLSASDNFYQLNDGVFGTIIQAAGGIKFNTAGTNERMRIDSSGNVGIGTTSPTSTLEVAGTVRTDLIQTRSDGLMTMSYLNLNTDTGSSSGTNNVTLASANMMDFLIDTNNNSTTGAFVFGTDNSAMSSATELMRLNESGNLGIGTSAPASLLNLSHATAPELRFSRTGTGQQWVQSIDSSGRLLFLEAASTGGTLYTRMVIDDTGEVGIGTGAPSYKLAIRDDSASAYPLSLESATIGTPGNHTGIRFGYTGNTYQKGAIIFEGQDANGRGKMYFAMEGGANSSNADETDAKMTLSLIHI